MYTGKAHFFIFNFLISLYLSAIIFTVVLYGGSIVSFNNMIFSGQKIHLTNSLLSDPDLIDHMNQNSLTDNIMHNLKAKHTQQHFCIQDNISSKHISFILLYFRFRLIHVYLFPKNLALPFLLMCVFFYLKFGLPIDSSDKLPLSNNPHTSKIGGKIYFTCNSCHLIRHLKKFPRQVTRPC